MGSKKVNQIRQLENQIDSLLPRDIRTLKSDELLKLVPEYTDLVSGQARREGPMFPAEGDKHRGLTLAERPVFICGVPRSGTTLLHGLLHGHESLCALPSEGSFLTSLQPRLRAMKEEETLEWFTKEWVTRLINIGTGPHWLLGRSSEDLQPYITFARSLLGWESVIKRSAATMSACHLHTALMLAFWSVYYDKKIATHWVDKTPTNEFHVPQLLKNYPEAKFIHLLRDPRAVIASRLRLQRDVGLGDHNLRQLLLEIRHSLKLALKYPLTIGRDRYLLVRYERLTATPQAVMQEVAEFLQLNYTSDMCRPALHGEFAIANTSFVETTIAQGAVYRSSENLFESYLSAKEQQLISASLATLARRCQFPLEPAPLYRRLRYFSTELAASAIRTVIRVLTS